MDQQQGLGNEQDFLALFELANRAPKSKAEELWLINLAQRYEQLKKASLPAKDPPK